MPAQRLAWGGVAYLGPDGGVLPPAPTVPFVAADPSPLTLPCTAVEPLPEIGGVVPVTVPVVELETPPPGVVVEPVRLRELLDVPGDAVLPPSPVAALPAALPAPTDGVALELPVAPVPPLTWATAAPPAISAVRASE